MMDNKESGGSERQQVTIRRPPDQATLSKRAISWSRSGRGSREEHAPRPALSAMRNQAVK
jgi:hypothetical protein